ncbi:MAG: FAD-binding oxidoreductase [Bacteroidia bacterium]|nr:FAD-binding oxidoreductase [Bacteroidia bacterium]MCZ2248127.1 FAD-binding oxidoreductase [Bacteroidia bacterium]
MNLSYWEKKSFFGKQHLIIVGSGIVGLNAAICYKQKNPKNSVMLVDRGIIPQGASSKNAGFACIGSAGEIISDLKLNDESSVFLLVERRYKGLSLLRKIVGDKDLDYKAYGGFELFENDQKFDECVNKLDYLNKKLAPITGIKETYSIADPDILKFGFKGVKHLIKNNCEGQIDTGMMMRKLMKIAQDNDIILWGGVHVKSILRNSSTTGIEIEQGGIIEADKVLICTNGFASELIPQITVKPARAQVLITSEIKNLRVQGSFHYDEGFYYFRNINQRILFGGARNMDIEGETTTEMVNTDAIINRLKEMLNDIIIPDTDYKVDMTWSGIMGFGQNKQPIVKQLYDNVYCAVGMGGMGVAIGSLVGQEIVELMMNS